MTRTGRSRLAGAALLLAGCSLTACSGDVQVQSILHPAGEGARSIATLWWALFGMGMTVYVVVLSLATWGLLRQRRREVEPREDRAGLWLGIGGVVVPTIILSTVLVLTLGTLARDAAAERSADALVVKVVGKQWWWEIDYQHETPSRRLRTANELHVPVGTTVKLELESRDVIHSFWVPELQAKRDLVPGRKHEFWLRADRPGTYRGQCAEYCGIQHANMALVVVAHEPAEFAAWYEAQLRPAADPTDALALEGQRVFLEKPCAMCHAVRGTYALAEVGPDLTHLASRRLLAAGAVKNSRGDLGGWISNPQRIKPGSHMPNVNLSSRELRALLTYLETLR
jgi:cytochrome c oxidase subunit 2